MPFKIPIPHQLKSGHRQAFRHGRDLQPVADRTASIKPGNLLVFTVCRNEMERLAFFLDYYRARGADHFLFIDNDSSDGSSEYLTAQPDCSLWNTATSYRDSNFGVHWLNSLLRKHGTGHWCLTLDPDEFLVTPHADTRDLKELCSYLDANKKSNFFSILLDMYPPGAVEDASYSSGQDPLDVAPWFDPAGYHQVRSTSRRDWWVRGGVRRRFFFADRPHEAPALNKTVLVRWQKHFLYLSSTHTLWPYRLNNPHFNPGHAPTGCLLHFKYLSLFRQKIEEEKERKQHYAGSREYAQYAQMMRDQTVLRNEGSACFEDWRQLLDLGLLNTGRWF